jgi:hypothetical protein
VVDPPSPPPVAEEPYYPPAPTPPPPPPGTRPFTPAPAASASPEARLSQVLESIRAEPAASTAIAEQDTSRPFSERESSRSTTVSPPMQVQQQTMQRIVSGQAGIAVLQVALANAAYNAQFSGQSGFGVGFNNGFSTGLSGSYTANRFSSSFAFQQNRLF